MRWSIAIAALVLAACSGGDVEPPPPPSEAFVTPPTPGTATSATQYANRVVAERLPLDDPSDGEDARRGRIAKIEDDAIRNANGDVVWSIAQFDFIDGEAPDTVNPSLWRQSKLAAEHGLFEVADGIWQVRGYDLSVMSVIEGETGWIIVDPLTAVETAAASLKLVNDTLGERPVTGVLYTHSHADHFGGARGVISEEEIEARGVPVLAPIGFSHHAVSENLLAGPHMSRRAVLMFGNTLPRTTTGQVGSGLGPGLPNGEISLVLPTEEIEGRGTQRTIDGVLFEFIDAAGTEAPAEFMFYLPEKRALCTAEVATATFHNVLTPRGAQVRDALAWSRAIDYVLAEYGDKSDVVFASHHWPTWGQENVAKFLETQRNIYRYVHDQTLRRANSGATMAEAAEAVAEPEISSRAFDTRGYYGTLNHNSKAVYQSYFGWWGGVPAEYHALPHEKTAPRYVAAMGGAEAAVELGVEAFNAGDYRWAAELLNHVVFADAKNEDARTWLAAAYEQLGFQAESGAWRSYYLTAAQELRNGVPDVAPPQLGNPDFLRAIPALALFDAIASRYDPEANSRDPYVLNFNFDDGAEVVSVHIGPDVIVPRPVLDDDAKATVSMARTTFDRLLLDDANLLGLLTSRQIRVNGDALAVRAFFGALDEPDFWFNVATP